MGEVYRGYDERLERQVALKRVRSGVRNPNMASKRLRREARAAAQLRHPAIVQVYDWVETEDDAWLVMELVEGRSLRELLHAGPLEPARVVGFAHDLLEGLAVAHVAGLVHRDFKAENIMITAGSSSGRGRGEQVKILDFGLAKKTAPEMGDTQISVEGKILGTLSAMAPEQVLGEEVDGRTDLFALGCLLYEALTGRQPFIGNNAAETLNRICMEPQVPVHELTAGVSPSLSAFVDHLLEKDRRRRPTSALEALDILDRVSTDSLDSLDYLATEDFPTALETSVPSAAALSSGTPRLETAKSGIAPGRLALVLATVLAMFLLASLWLLRPLVELKPVYVAVPETVIGTQDDAEGAEEKLAAQAIHAALIQGLVDLRGVVALEVPATEAGTMDPRVLARTLAAGEVMMSRLDCGPQGCQAELRRVSGEDGSILWTRSLSADTSRLLDLSQAVLGFLPDAFPDRERRVGAAAFEVDPGDYETYLRLRLQSLHLDQGMSREQLMAQLTKLGEASPRFAAIPVLEAHIALGLFQVSRTPEALELAHQALERARSLAPEDPQVLILAARAARYSGDLETTTQLLDTLRRLEPGNVEAQFQRALVYEREGKSQDAITITREVVQRLPSLYLLFSASDLLSRLGNFEGTRELIEQGLARAPESFDGQSRLAQLELAHGDLNRAVELYTALVERSPESTVLINLGTALMMLGRFDEAIRCFEQETERHPESPYATLNLADVKKLGGEVKEAMTLYERVVDLAISDPQPERLGLIKAQALAHLGRREQAVEAVQAALRGRPDSPWTAYEAAVVYVLIEERASALWNARRALKGGVEPRWFMLPWFDSIRGELRGEDLALSSVDGQA